MAPLLLSDKRGVSVCALLPLFLLFACTGVYAQKIDVTHFFNTYPEESYIYLENSEHASISVGKDGLTLIQKNHEELMILKGTLNRIRSRKIRTSSFVKVRNLSAHILVYNGKGHSREKLGPFALLSENSGGGTFYDDDKFYTVNFANAREGDIIVIDYEEEFTEPRFFGAFFVSSYVPVMNSRFSVTFPSEGVDIGIKEVNNQSITISKEDRKDKRTRTLLWRADSVPALTDEDLDESYKNKASFIMLSLRNYRYGDSTIRISGTLDNLYSWYGSLLKNVDISDDAALTALTDSLTRNEPDEKSKLRRIYYWVQNKIAYLAYEDGLGGYIPREASVVCKRKFGDCKDMANLIVRMGKISGLPVHHAWIGTREIPFQFSEFPAPFCANHMIAVYVSDRDTIFLDATGKNHPFGLPTSMIQGKEALIGIDQNNYLIARVPFTGKRLNMAHDSIVLKISDGDKLEGRGYYTITGYEKIRVANQLEKKSYNDQKRYMRDLLEKGNNKFRLDTFYTVQNDIEKPLIIGYEFLISDYLTSYDNHNYVNLNFDRDYFDRLNLSKRKNPVDFGYQAVNKLSVKLDISEGFTFDHTPDNISVENHLLGFRQSYSNTGNSVMFSNTISVNNAKLISEDFADAGKVINAYLKNKSSLVSFTVKK